MALLCRNLVSSLRRRTFRSATRSYVKVTMGDPLEHATGDEKRELLAKLAGNEDPWDLKLLVRRGPGTRDDPTEIPSAFESRMIGCICHDDACSINYMMLHKGHPKRCECGYWFTLVHKSPI